MKLHVFLMRPGLRAFLFTIGFLLLFDLAWSQQITFPDANLRAEILNEYGVTVKGANNAAVLVAGTNKIDFSQLNATNSDPTTHGTNGVTQIFADYQAQINDLSGLEQLPNLTFLDIQGNAGLLFPAGFTDLPLQNLDLSQNNLTTLPANFNTLNSLTTLIISANKFTSLPNLPTGLLYMEAQANALTSLPSLPSGLSFLDIETNHLTSLPLLPNSLSMLFISDNLIAQLPDLPTGLTNFNAFKNNLTSLPSLPAGLTTLSLQENNISNLPPLPASLIDLNVQHNRLTSLPAFPAALVKPDISYNNLTFEDIEPVISFYDPSNGEYVYYDHQANFSITPATKTITTGQSLNLTVAGFIAGSVNNRYQWFKDGVAVSQVSVNPAFSVANVTQADAGDYVCVVTNMVVTGLTISSDPVTVAIAAPIQQWNQYDNTNSPIADASKITSITVGSDNSVWMAAGDIVYRRKADDTWMQYPIATTNGLVYASVIAAGLNGIVWVGANDQSNKLSRFDGTTWQQVQIPQSLINNPYFSFSLGDMEISNQYLWVASNYGVLQFDGQAWTKLDYQNKVNSPTSLSWDATNQELWISNNCAGPGNAFKYAASTNTWNEYLLGNSNCAHAIQAINGGALVGSCNFSSLVAIKNEEVQPYVNSECISVGTVAVDPTNNAQAWFGSENTFSGSTVPYGLILFDGNSVIKNFNNTNSSMKGNGVSGIAAQQIGNTITLWLITYLYNVGDLSIKYFLETYTYSTDGLASQSITFNALPTKSVTDTPFTLTATASSGLPVTYKNSDANVATIAGNTVTIKGAGVTTITASQAGDATYNAAPDVTRVLTVTSSGSINITGNLQFGDQVAGVDHPVKSFTIVNTGSGTLTVHNITLPAGYTAEKISGAIATGKSLTVAVTFTPIASQDYSGTIEVTSDATSGTSTIQISGRGLLIAGVGEQNNSEAIQVYPNPSKGIFTLHIKDSNGNVILIDETGRTFTIHLVSLGSDNYKLDIGDKADGVYMLKCEHGKGMVAFRVVKN